MAAVAAIIQPGLARGKSTWTRKPLAPQETVSAATRFMTRRGIRRFCVVPARLDGQGRRLYTNAVFHDE
jgi:hypothetical protein